VVTAARRSWPARAIEHFTLRSSRAARPAQSSELRALSATLADVRAGLERSRAQWIDADSRDALASLDEAERRFAEALAASPSLAKAALPYTPLAPDARRTIATYSARARALSLALDRVQPSVASSAANALTLASRWLVALVVATGTVRAGSAMLERSATDTTASATWGPAYQPANARDHNPSTSWLLPDGTVGWIEATFSRRPARMVKLTNVQRLPSYGAQRCTIELKRGGAVVFTREIDAASTVGSSAPYIVDLPSPVEADALRVYVRSFHGLGGGFSEIDVE
jgi:hypothetical protein